MNNNKIFIFIFLILLTTFTATAYSCTSYWQPGSDPLSKNKIECLGTGKSSIPSEMGDLSVVASYNLRGGYQNGFIANNFDRYTGNKEFIFIDTIDDNSNNFRVVELQYVNGQIVKPYETAITGVGVIDISPYMKPVLFDLDNDGKVEIIFIVKDGSSSKLLSYGIDSNGNWEKTVIATLGNSNAWERSRIVCNVITGGSVFDGRFCAVAGDGDNYMTGYNNAGNKEFSVAFSMDILSPLRPSPEIWDVDGDGTLEVLTVERSDRTFRIYTEGGSEVYNSYTDDQISSVDRMIDYNYFSINGVKYVAYESYDSGNINFVLLDTASDYSRNFKITKSVGWNANSYGSGQPIFMPDTSSICYPYYKDSDYKLGYYCYDVYGNETASGVSNAITTNNLYYSSFISQGEDYSIPVSSSTSLIFNNYNMYLLASTGTISSIMDFSNLYPSGSYGDAYAVHPPAIGDIDCDGKLDLASSVCDVDESPCGIRFMLSGNGHSSCTATGGQVSNVSIQCFQCTSGVLYNTHFLNTCGTGWSLTIPDDCEAGTNQSVSLTTCYKCVDNNRYSSQFEGNCGVGWSDDSQIDCGSVTNETLSTTNYLPEILLTQTNYKDPWNANRCDNTTCYLNSTHMMVFYAEALDKERDKVYDKFDCGSANATMYRSLNGEVQKYVNMLNQPYNPLTTQGVVSGWQPLYDWGNIQTGQFQINYYESQTGNTGYSRMQCRVFDGIGRKCTDFYGCIYQVAGNYTPNIKFADESHQFLGNTGTNWYTQKVWNVTVVNWNASGNYDSNGVIIGYNYTYNEVFNNTNLPSTNNSIKNFLNIDFIKNTGLGSTVLWFLIMIILAIVIWAYGHGSPMSTGVIVFTEMLMMIIGTYLGFIGIGIIIVLTIVSLAVLVVYMRNLFLGTSG